MITMSKKNVYVLWSGGMDSTYLIQKLLTENDNVNVTTGYVEVMNNVNKTKNELKAIKKLLPILTSKYGDRFSHMGIVYKTDVICPSMRFGLEQMPLWISALVSTTPVETDLLCLGYVMCDCAISYLKELQDLIKAYNKISDIKLPKLTFPISKYPKWMILEKLDKQLKPHVVWCENPVEVDNELKPCKRCEACKHSPIMEEEVAKGEVKEESIFKKESIEKSVFDLSDTKDQLSVEIK